MAKNLDFDREARLKIKSGVNQLAKAVKVTLGPRGRNVVIEKEHGEYISTKDGVTVAKEVFLSDPLENAGAQMVKEVSSQVNDEAGDGTTTATVLADEIINEGFRAIENGANPIELKRGIDKAVKCVVSELEKISKDIKSSEEVRNIARISANNDSEVGNLIASAIDKVGKEGVVTVEESKTAESYLETVEGMQFVNGYLSPYFITNQTNMQVELENPLILLVDFKITILKAMVKPLEYCIAQSRPLLIIAEAVDGEALAGLIVNKARGTLQVSACKAPGFGDKRLAQLEDIAALTGATVVNGQKAMKMQDLDPEWFGSARLVTMDNKNTTIIDGEGTPEAIKARVDEITTLIENSDSHYDIEQLQERLGKLSGGVAICRIGADSELEMEEKKFRVEDSLCATRAALDEGIIPGGGIALMNAGLSAEVEVENDDQRTGANIIQRACKAPFVSIMDNAGVNWEMIWMRISAAKSDTKGYDARSEKIVDMLKEGIIDPAKVTRTAIEKAGSVAGTIITTECLITNKPEEAKEQVSNPMMGM